MKNIKKLLSIVMVLAMVLSLGVSALADVTVSLPKDTDGTSDYDGHTMVAYKIFEGTMNSDQESNRSDPQDINDGGKAALGVTGWADGIDGGGLMLRLAADYADFFATKPDIKINTNMSAWDAAMAISELSQWSDFDAVKFSQTVAEYINKEAATKVTFKDGAAELSSGYWIIVDETTFADGAMPEDFAYSAYLLEVVGNTNLQLADKVDIPTVEKKVNSVDSDVAGLNEIVEFTITATLPQDYAKYDSYYLAFVDTMDNTLDYVNDPNDPTRAAFITWPDKTTTDVTTLDWDTTSTSGKYTFKYEISDLKTAKPGLSAGDEIVLTFYAKVTDRTLVRTYNDAHIEYSNNPNNVGEPHGHTPDDRVIVFTFTFNGNKVDQNENPLPGAKFTLYKVKEDGTKDVFETPTDGAKQTVTYKGTEYTLYRNEKEAASDGEGHFKFDFSQLGEGKYLLVETTVPAGYNQMDDYPFSVEMTTDSKGNITGARVLDSNGEEITGDVTIVFPEDPKTGDGTGTGTVNQDIKNQSGLELPETGGIGTTIFYIVGAILVAGAVILLVTKRRVNGAEK